MDKYQQILKEYWGYDDFRGIQREIIESIGAGADTLGLMPTGGGKSITFQVPALAMDGVCLVITPLIALMKDQVMHLRRRGIQAAAIYSGMSHQEILTTLENAVYGGVKLLYVSPERLSSDLFQAKLAHMDVSFITVDEAHCISQWGYDFRPSYLEIANIRTLVPHAPVLALTATATPQVVDDIQKRLAFSRKRVFKMSFERKNLAYIVRKTTDKISEMIHILRSVNGSAIVYVRSRKRSKDISEILNSHDITATFYHAGLEPVVKDERQTDWQNDQIRVMVATNAFGMGIDKPDVRLVIHIDCPDSIEAYFQEAGRGGRDGKKAYAVLLYNSSDNRKLNKRIADTFPEKNFIREVYDHLAYFYQIAEGCGAGETHEFNIDVFCRNFHHFPVQVDSALKILERCGYIQYDVDPDTSARVWFRLTRSELDQLNALSPAEEKIVMALLRNYGGLFTDFVYIDEAFIAQQTAMSHDSVYLLLKSLHHKRIITFVPRRKMPTITYWQRREEGYRISIPPSVFEERKAQYEARIKSILAYAQSEDECRSRQLLRYFGEKRSSDCHQCDVCIQHQTDRTDKSRMAPAKKAILQLLEDRKHHHITELRKLNLPTDQLGATLDYLVQEEIIRADGSFISL